MMRHVWFAFAAALAASLISSCGLQQREGASDRLPQGSTVSEGLLTARTFKPSLVKMPPKEGYLMLREPYLSREFKTFYAASLGPESDIRTVWTHDQLTGLYSEQTTLRINGKPVKVYFAQLKRPFGQALEVMYAWIQVEGRGCKVEVNDIKPKDLLSEKGSGFRERMKVDLKEFAESLRLTSR